MDKLITTDDIANIRQIATNVDPTAIDPYIIETQRAELQNVLGFRFFNVVLYGLAQPSPAARFTDLLNGKNYTIGGGTEAIPVEFSGLKPIIAYYAYARALPALGKRVTRFGPVKKASQFSEHVEGDELAGMVNEAKSFAKVYVEELKRFLEFNQTVYPEYFTSNAPTPAKLSISISATPKKRPSYE